MNASAATERVLASLLQELPSNIVLQKVGARYWLSGIVLAFGVITIGMAFVKTWEQLAVCRVLLGVFEAGFFPSVRWSSLCPEAYS